MDSKAHTRSGESERLARPGRTAWWVISCIAIGLHLALLLIPSQQQRQADRPGIIRLDLELAGGAARETPALPEAELPPPADDTPDLRPEPGIDTIPQAPAPAPRPESTFSAAMLFRQIESVDGLETPPPPRKLGIPVKAQFPTQWARPVLPLVSGPFTDLFAPLETEILDQWQQPDGTRRVVMRTPNGQRLCGRLDPWDPFNPLFEPVPMFQLC